MTCKLQPGSSDIPAARLDPENAGSFLPELPSFGPAEPDYAHFAPGARLDVLEPASTPLGDLSQTFDLLLGVDDLLKSCLGPELSALPAPLGAAAVALDLVGAAEEVDAEGLTGREASATVAYRFALEGGLNLGLVTLGGVIGGPVGAILAAGASAVTSFLTQPRNDLREIAEGEPFLPLQPWADEGIAR